MPYSLSSGAVFFPLFALLCSAVYISLPQRWIILKYLLFNSFIVQLTEHEETLVGFEFFVLSFFPPSSLPRLGLRLAHSLTLRRHRPRET